MVGRRDQEDEAVTAAVAADPAAQVRERSSRGLAPHLLEAALMVLLKRRPRHGYALVGPIRDLGVEVGDITRLYRALRQLEADGLIAATWDTTAGGRGPARKVYALTRSGHRHLRQVVKDMRSNLEAMARIDARYIDPGRDQG